MATDDLLAGLPGEQMLRQGIADWRAGRITPASCLASIGSPRLRRAGLVSGLPPAGLLEAERQLYRLLCQEGGDAYSRYNALTRELISFEQALDRRLRHQRTSAD